MKEGEIRTKSQSEVVGVVLLLGISIISIGVIILLAQPLVNDATVDATVDRVQNDLVLLDSRFSAAGFGTSNNESIRLDLGDGSLSSDPDSTFVNVTLDGNSLYEGNVGKIEYTNGGESIAYEGGGIWRREVGGSVMVSPPEIGFEDETLRVPVYNVTTQEALTGTHTISVVGGDNVRRFPDPAAGRVNPTSGRVNITVESDYYEAWARYFENSLGATVTVEDSQNRVEAELVGPETLDSIDAAGVSEKEYVQPANDPFNGDVKDGVTYPSVDGLIESYVEYGENNIGSPQVEDVTFCESQICGDDMNEPQVYFNDTDYTMDGEKFDVGSTGENITVIVDGDLTIKNMNLTNAVFGNSLTVVTTGDLKLAEGYSVQNAEGVEKVVFQTKSDREVSFNGDGGSGTGVIYAPDSLVSLTEMGDSDWTGPVVGEVIAVDGVSPDASVTFSGSVDVQRADGNRNLYVTERRVGIER